MILNIIWLNQKESEEVAADLTPKKVHNLEEAKPANNLEIDIILELEAMMEGNLEVDEKPDQDVALVRNLNEELTPKLEIALVSHLEI